MLWQKKQVAEKKLSGRPPLSSSVKFPYLLSLYAICDLDSLVSSDPRPLGNCWVEPPANKHKNILENNGY